ncbi:MAG: hypothetical protein JOY59_08290 [Candidatus Eremiobacteraeota bacterium]|nr:hypothetical protein [Candidatus Eremiobacteraeota bacterium]
MILRAVIFTIGFAFGAAAQAVAQLATPAPAPQPPGEPTAVPSAAPTPSATPAPTPTTLPASPAPSPTPFNPYKYVVEPSPNPNAAAGAPQIFRIEFNDSVLHPGGQVAVRVTTTTNVSRVTGSTEGYRMEIQKAQDGVFAGLSTIPGFIPSWYLRTYQVTFTAETPDGKKASFTIPVTLAR